MHCQGTEAETMCRGEVVPTLSLYATIKNYSCSNPQWEISFLPSFLLSSFPSFFVRVSVSFVIFHFAFSAIPDNRNQRKCTSFWKYPIRTSAELSTKQNDAFVTVLFTMKASVCFRRLFRNCYLHSIHERISISVHAVREP
jgi:hypothetical protein